MGNVNKKAEETVIKLLDWVQKQIEDGSSLMAEDHSLPEVLEASVKLIAVLKGPEVISPSSKLEEVLHISKKDFGKEAIRAIANAERKVTKPYCGVPVNSQKPDLSDQIRKIVREEIAAHEERLNKTWKPLIPSSYQSDTQD